MADNPMRALAAARADYVRTIRQVTDGAVSRQQARRFAATLAKNSERQATAARRIHRRQQRELGRIARSTVG